MTEQDLIRPRPTRLSRLLPWTRLFKGPALSLDARKLVLAAIGILLLSGAWNLLDRLFARQDVRSFAVERVPSLESLLSTQTFAAGVAEPFLIITSPFVSLFRNGAGPVAFAHALMSAILAVAVWGIFGGAIARMASVQQATGSRISISAALRFALRRWVALIGAPLSPLIGIGFFAALCAPIGLLYQTPGNTGPAIAGVLAFLPLLAGLVMALLTAGLAVGWPLMTATVSVEAEDAFDSLSRAYSYVTQRLGRYGAYAFVSWAVGTVGLIVVSSLAALVVHMAQWGLAFGGPDEKIATLFASNTIEGPAPVAIHAFWVSFVQLLVHAWIYSYFFSTATLIYGLLRKDVDGRPYEHIGGLNPKQPVDLPKIADSKPAEAPIQE